MTDSFAIETLELTRSFRLFRNPTDFLTEVITGRQRHDLLTALDQVSFTIAPGEVVGLIGPNGAGKSTLVRVLTGALPASSGKLAVNGRIKAVSELGIGFHSDYTGSDNVLLGGLALGYSRIEIESRREWITQFSELGSALSRPLSTYSAGMKARLGFCVAFCQVPEILVVDEALSVGDSAFASKCIAFLLDLCRNGRTVIMVSHNLDMIRRICSRVIYINGGRLIADGPPDEVVTRYEADSAKHFVQSAAEQPIPAYLADASLAEVARSYLPEPVRRKLEAGLAVTHQEVSTCPFLLHLRLIDLVTLELLDRDGHPVTEIECGSPATVRAVVDSVVEWPDLVANFQIHDEHSNLVASVNSCWSLGVDGKNDPIVIDFTDGRFTIEFKIDRLSLGASRYTLGLGISPPTALNEESRLLFRPRELHFAIVRSDFTQWVFYEPLGSWAVDKSCR